MTIVFLGLSITSSWGNGHATNYRALQRALVERGHDVLFLEREVPWYAAHRDLPAPPWGRTELYRSPAELQRRFEGAVADADLVVVGSYVPDGVAVAEWALATAHAPVAFWDIDTPITVGKLEEGDEEYLSRALVPRFDLYLSFTGGPLLERIEQEFCAKRARAFYCMADPSLYRPLDEEERWLLGYIGTYSAERQPAVDELLVEPARRLPDAAFVVAGPQYPPELEWPASVARIEHLAPAEHPHFYSRQRFTLNLTRPAMVRAGWSPSVRLFEAAACGVPVISDAWAGLDHFFRPGAEIVVAQSAADVVETLEQVSPDEARAMGAAARRWRRDAAVAWDAAGGRPDRTRDQGFRALVPQPPPPVGPRDGAGPPTRGLPAREVVGALVGTARGPVGLARARRRLQRGLLQLRARQARRRGAGDRRRRALPAAGSLGRAAVRAR
jgi:spore maturation protein CgeB